MQKCEVQKVHVVDAALHAEERKLESQLNEMRGEFKSKKEEMEELSTTARMRLDKAATAEKAAKEAIDQSYVVKEGEYMYIQTCPS